MHQPHNKTARTEPAPVIALHCSGAGANQWRQLGEVLGPSYELMAPEHYGTERTGPWTGAHAFTLGDEAARTIELIDRSERAVHLVGHSYGGGVALHAALARPGRVASLTLYEPSAFHLLKCIGEHGAAAFAEISAVARATERGAATGDYRSAAIAFVDYWSGAGAWDALRPSVQAALIRWMPKAPLDFHALIEEPNSVGAYAELRMPVMIMRGEHAPRSTRVIAETLPKLLPATRMATIDGAGHMGPLTHSDAVSSRMAAHINAVEGTMPGHTARNEQAVAYGGRRLMAEAVW
jgi:pimeloyl-ACP methyl ester carboxylesterase